MISSPKFPPYGGNFPPSISVPPPTDCIQQNEVQFCPFIRLSEATNIFLCAYENERREMFPVVRITLEACKHA